MKHITLSALSLLALFAGTSASARDYWFGADLSYVNEMQDCGGRYSYAGETDPYKIFAKSGHNLVRVRLWNNPTWTKYSNLADAEKTIAAAKASGQKVLLDFHYSDDWADGEKQLAPAAWEGMTDQQQADALYKFTVDTLKYLETKGLMPDMVQVGNESNKEIVSSWEGAKLPINWKRNALLFQAGIKGVRDASVNSAIKPQIMLHIAQPENVEPWFAAAREAGVTDYDIIGISYYRKWSKYDTQQLAGTIQRVRHAFGKEVVVVETAYAFTDGWNDEMGNLLGTDSILPGYPITPEGQAKYMHDLMQLVIDSGGNGVVYWEPAWVSTKCKTRWGTGSSWENAAFFDFKGKAVPAIDWPKASYVMPVEVTFAVADRGQPALYLAGDFTGGVIVPMTKDNGKFLYKAWLRPGSAIVAAVAATEAAVGDAEAQEVTVPSVVGTVTLGTQP
jgi:arabinogalactan endo-1,4-beta-galactosidase